MTHSCYAILPSKGSLVLCSKLSAIMSLRLLRNISTDLGLFTVYLRMILVSGVCNDERSVKSE
jgi:hypothetical protein